MNIPTPETDAFLAKGCTVPELQKFARHMERRLVESMKSRHYLMEEIITLRDDLRQAEVASDYWMKQANENTPA